MSQASAISLAKLSYSYARQHGVLVIYDDAPILLRRPDAKFEACLEARRIADCSLLIKDVTAPEFETHLARLYAHGDLNETAVSALEGPEDLVTLADNLPQSADLLDSNDDAPVIRLINGILSEAINSRASDIHIEPYENRLSVRFRIDGHLRDILSLSTRLSSVLVSRVKVMSKLDIAKKRVPQDGRFSLKLGDRDIDVRVSTLPSQYGERLVMRILEKTSSLMNLCDLGMNKSALSNFQQALKRPNGIILVTGPTGSGKTTTLYSALSGLNDGSRNILTVEDPVEYALDGIGQTQVNNQVGMSFAAGLRAILRQDPDVVMVGEIRDPETAEIAVQSSLTGHLVLSTVHTNSAIGAVTRLRDMGIEPFLLSSTVTAIVAQRLVRRLCDRCKAPYAPNVRELAELDMPKDTISNFYRPTGCQNCDQTGYIGRLGIYEVLIMDDVLRAMVHEQASEIEISDYVFKTTQSLLQNGVAQVRAGQTSHEEVLRVCKTHWLDDAVGT